MTANMTPRERAARQAREEKQRVQAAAVEWRRRAAQGAYAGVPGEDAGYAAAQLLDTVALSWRDQPEAVRRSALTLCRLVLDGPDGASDPRGGSMKPLTAGPGH